MQLVAPPKAPIPTELLVYCHAPVSPADLPLQMALIIVVENHKQYADCYRRQAGLVDAVKRRDK